MVQPTPSPWCPRMCAKGMQVKWGATQAGEPRTNGWVGTPKWGCERVTVHPCVHARGRVCKRGSMQPRWGWQANGRVGAPKRRHEREPVMGKSAPPCACKGGECASRAACKQKGGAHPFHIPAPSKST